MEPYDNESAHSYGKTYDSECVELLDRRAATVVWLQSVKVARLLENLCIELTMF